MLSVGEQVESFNARAEAKRLAAWESWERGMRPAGYFKRSELDKAAEFYSENGFLVLQDALSEEEIASLRHETALICRGERGDIPGFFPGLPGESDEDAMRRYLCIHFPHKTSETMRSTLDHAALVQVLTSLIGPNVKCMQSMLFIKASGKPGQAWHQDEFYIPTRDRSLTGGWIAMDDATVENGCLWVLPGSQKRGVIYMQEEHHDRRFDCSGESRGFEYTNDQAVPVEVKAGSVVFFNGYLLHRSLPNYTEKGFRRSLVNHYMSAESLLPWFGAHLPHDDHVAIADNRDVVLVAGADPYSYKGIENRNGPHVRPSGEGGCGSQSRNEEALKSPYDED
jgi:phytanoyl-CoA hydroxylase